MTGIFEKEEIPKLSCATACLIGDAYYYYKFFIGKFLLSQDSDNLLLQNIRGDIDDVVFLASFQALGIIEKLILYPFFRNVTQF